MGNLWKSIYGFFDSDRTPGSGFYVTLLGVLGNFGTYALGSGNPWLMVAGAACAGIYGAAHALAGSPAAGTSVTLAVPPIATSPAPAAVAAAYPATVDPAAPDYAAPQPQVGSDAPIVDETMPVAAVPPPAPATAADIIGVTLDTQVDTQPPKV